MHCLSIPSIFLPLPSYSLLHKLNSQDIDTTKALVTLRNNQQFGNDVVLLLDEMYLQQQVQYVIATFSVLKYSLLHGSFLHSFYSKNLKCSDCIMFLERDTVFSEYFETVNRGKLI